MKLFRKVTKKENQVVNSKDAAKERLHLVLMQDRANVSADFLELMKQEIIEVIKKYIEVDETAIDVRLTNKENADGTNGAPALYANIPIMNIKDEVRQNSKTGGETEAKKENDTTSNNKEQTEENSEEQNKKIEDNIHENNEETEKQEEKVTASNTENL